MEYWWENANLISFADPVTDLECERSPADKGEARYLVEFLEPCEELRCAIRQGVEVQHG